MKELSRKGAVDPGADHQERRETSGILLLRHRPHYELCSRQGSKILDYLGIMMLGIGV